MGVEGLRACELRSFDFVETRNVLRIYIYIYIYIYIDRYIYIYIYRLID